MSSPPAARAPAPASPTPDSRRAPTRFHVAAWSAVLLCALLLSLAGYDSFQLGAYKDDASYAVLARSLVYSEHYGLANVPGEPAPTRYPFGFPLLLAPLVLLFPNDPNALKLLSLGATLLNVALIFWGWPAFARRASYGWALAAAALYAFAPLTVWLSHTVLSEAVFTTLCLSALVLTESSAAPPPTRTRRILTLALLSVVLFLAVFVRTIGLVLVVTVLSYLVVRRRAFARDAAFVLGGIVALTILVVALTPVRLSDLFPTEYVSQLAAPAAWDSTTVATPLVLRFAGTLAQYSTSDFRQILLPFGGGAGEQAFADRLGLPALPLAIALLSTALLALGLVVWYRRYGLSAALLFTVLYVLALIIWPWGLSRLLYPVQPQLFFAFLLGIAALLSALARAARSRALLSAPAARVLPNLALGAVALTLISISAYYSLHPEDSRAHVGDLPTRSLWLKSNTPPDAVVMSEEPQTDYLYAGRRTVPYGGFDSLPNLEQYLAANRVAYILVAPRLQWLPEYTVIYSDAATGLLALLQTPTPALAEVYASSDGTIRIYQFRP